MLAGAVLNGGVAGECLLVGGGHELSAELSDGLLAGVGVHHQQRGAFVVVAVGVVVGYSPVVGKGDVAAATSGFCGATVAGGTQAEVFEKHLHKEVFVERLVQQHVVGFFGI